MISFEYDGNPFEIPECFYRVSVKALIKGENGTFLLLQDETGFWAFPGGGMEIGETPQEALKRELFEEIGIETTSIASSPLFVSSTLTDKKIPILFLYFEAQLAHLNFSPSEECVRIGFFDKQQASQLPHHPSVREFLKLY